jgi:hypothetical protein
MSGTVPRLPWRSAVFALAAVVCLFAAASALAAHRPRPTATPLWEAYPLAGKVKAPPAAQDGATEATTTPAAAPQSADSLQPTNASAQPVTRLRAPDRKVDPAIVVLFYIAIVTLIVTLALLVRRHVRRARSPRTARG